MWSRRRGRSRRKIRVDSGADFDLELRLHDGGSRRRVRISARDDRAGAPDRAECLLEGAGVQLRLQDGRIVIREDHGSREPAHLSIPVESCVSADVAEVRAPDGSPRLRLALQVEIGAVACEPTAFAMFFPTARRYRLTEFVHRISWSASPLPVSWTRTDLPRGGPTARHDPQQESSVDGSSRGAEDATEHRAGTAHRERGEPEEPLPEVAPPAPETADAAPPDAEEPPQVPRRVRRSGGNSGTSTFGRLAVTGVPDTGDWLSFRPLPSGSDVFTYLPPQDPGSEDSHGGPRSA